MQIKYTNKSLFKIERHFDNKPFFKVFGDFDNLTLEAMCYLIYAGCETEQSFDEWVDTFDMNTIKDIIPKVLLAVNESFDTGKKKVTKKA
jgi:hypothetical protein